MLSESARVTSAAEQRFRVQAPNSRGRATAIVALDAPSEAVVRRLASLPWNRATFLKAVNGAPAAEPIPVGWITDLDDRRTRLQDEIDASDQVIMVAAAGGHAEAAAMIGRACSLRRVTTTALIVGADTAADREVAKTLAQLRPWSLMVVIAHTDDYVADMMTALRV